MTTRDVGDISTNPGGRSGADWTHDACASIKALWALNGGMLLSVAGVNTLTATVAVKDGFATYSDGLRCAFVAVSTNTGPATINIGGLGAKTLRDPDGDHLPPGAIMAGKLVEMVYVANQNCFRLTGATGIDNVTVEGGIMLKRSEPTRLVSAVGPSSAAISIGSQSFVCSRSTSIVFVEGCVSRVTGAGEVNDNGLVVALCRWSPAPELHWLLSALVAPERAHQPILPARRH